MTPSSSELTPEALAFLQRRVATYAALSAAIGLAFWVQHASQLLAMGADEVTWESSPVFHTLGIAAMLVLFGLNWFGKRSEWFIRTAELVLIFASCVAYTRMVSHMPQVFRPNFTMLLVAMVLVLIRAVWIPSSWWWSALLGVLVSIPVLLTVWQRYEVIDPALLAAFEGHGDFFEVTPANIRIDNMIATAMWLAVATVISALASGVIYGLRREVRKARELGQYILEDKLGQGGMGVVYRARHAMLRRPTAVKLLHPERAGEENVARFEREVIASARLSHPNTVTVFDYGRTPDGVFYYAMELLEGATLTDVVQVDEPLAPARVAHFMHQVASALVEAHGMGLIHRDIKPDNIVVTERGGVPDVAKVVDYGLVKEIEVEGGVDLTGETTIVGTPRYLAPEAIKGVPLDDGRSDLYALGATAFFMLTGESVFEGDTAVEVCSKHLLTEPDRPSERLGGHVPEDLDSLVVRLLDKKPERRPESAEALVAEVEALECFGQWSRDNARRWWKDFGPELASSAQARRDEEASTGAARTIEIAART